nr:unnamed protein product [Digitaria exilis]
MPLATDGPGTEGTITSNSNRIAFAQRQRQLDQIQAPAGIIVGAGHAECEGTSTTGQRADGKALFVCSHPAIDSGEPATCLSGAPRLVRFRPSRRPHRVPAFLLAIAMIRCHAAAPRLSIGGFRVGAIGPRGRTCRQQRPHGVARLAHSSITM